VWDIKYSKFLSNIPKCISWERFGEDIWNIFFSPNVLQLDILLFDLFQQKIELDRNMLGLGMHHWIFGDIDSTSVVTEY
jgi:hypothetical protein